jgi:hypothetical protein
MIFPYDIMKQVEVSLIEHRQPNDVKLNIKERKLRSGVKWQGALIQKGVKQRLVL